MSGSTLAYRRAHKGICATLPLAEYLEVVRLASQRGISPTRLATETLRAEIARSKQSKGEARSEAEQVPA